MAYYTTNERSVPGTARSDQRGSYFGMYKTPKFAPPNQTSYMEQTMSVIVEDEPEAINARLFSSTTRETPKPASTRRRKASLLPSKEGRVKVAIRCRPPFEDELEETVANPQTQDDFFEDDAKEKKVVSYCLASLLFHYSLNQGPNVVRGSIRKRVSRLAIAHSIFVHLHRSLLSTW